MKRPFFTIGHSTRTVGELAALLQEAGATRVVDVRTIARSRANPQFDAETLAGSLAEYGIAYQRNMALGGLRGRTAGIAPATNAFWQNASFHNYADYAMTGEFRAGLEALRRVGHAEPVAIMCAEAVWWRCHRRIIADYLIAAGERVSHILGRGHIEPASMTPAARRTADGSLTYPAA